MQEVSNKVKQRAEKAARGLDDYRQRLSQVIDEEGDKIRKEADQESATIIARAREEYKQRLSQVIEEEGDKSCIG